MGQKNGGLSLENKVKPNYVEGDDVHKANPELELDRVTCGLLKLIPLDNSVVFSGDLLIDAYIALLNDTEANMSWDEFKFIDLYLIGSQDVQFAKALEILKILRDKFTESKAIVGTLDYYEPRVIVVPIVGIPRAIKLIYTNFKNFDELTNSFNLAHQAMYYTNTGFYISPFAKISIEKKQLEPNPFWSNRAPINDIIKYKLRNNMKIDSYIEQIVFTDVDSYNKINKTNYEGKLRKLYKNSNNLTSCFRDPYNSLGSIRLSYRLGPARWDKIPEIWTTSNFKPNEKENYLTDKLKELTFEKKEIMDQILYHVTFKTNINKYRYLVVKAKIKNFSVITDPCKYSFNVVWEISDPENIKFIKSIIRQFVDKLESESINCFQNFLIDSKALSQEEKVKFNTINNSKLLERKNIQDQNIVQSINECASSPNLCFYNQIVNSSFDDCANIPHNLYPKNIQLQNKLGLDIPEYMMVEQYLERCAF